MKYAWLLALPYVVTISTVSGPGDYLYTIMYHVGEFALGNKEQAEDFAQALNDAHEARVLRKEWNPPKGVDPDENK